jgi:hypothetical protein
LHHSGQYFKGGKVDCYSDGHRATTRLGQPIEKFYEFSQQCTLLPPELPLDLSLLSKILTMREHTPLANPGILDVLIEELNSGNVRTAKMPVYKIRKEVSLFA